MLTECRQQTTNLKYFWGNMNGSLFLAGFFYAHFLYSIISESSNNDSFEEKIGNKILSKSSCNVPPSAPFKQKSTIWCFFVRYIYNTSVSLQLVEHFKPVAKIVCYNYLILFIAEFNSLNVLYTGKSLFSITTLSISAYND